MKKDRFFGSCPFSFLLQFLMFFDVIVLVLKLLAFVVSSALSRLKMAERFAVKERSEADVAVLFDATVRQFRSRRILKRVRGWNRLNEVKKAFIRYVMENGGQSLLVEAHLFLEADGDEFRLMAQLLGRYKPEEGGPQPKHEFFMLVPPRYLS